MWSYFQDIIDKLQVICTYIQESERFQNIVLNTIWTYSAVCVISWQYAKHMYINNEIIRVPTDYILWVQEKIGILVSRRKLEPISDEWISTCTILDVSTTKPYFVETYEITNDLIVSDIQNPDNSVINRFRDMITRLSENNNKDTMDTVIIWKNKDVYNIRVSRNLMRSNIDSWVPINPVESDACETIHTKETGARLLSVEYTHPRMKESITLDIPRKMMIIGNQLLSPAFVRRCLEYQELPYEFDSEYVIRILDGEINQLILTSRQYLQIGVNGLGIGLL